MTARSKIFVIKNSVCPSCPKQSFCKEEAINCEEFTNWILDENWAFGAALMKHKQEKKREVECGKNHRYEHYTDGFLFRRESEELGTVE